MSEKIKDAEVLSERSIPMGDVTYETLKNLNDRKNELLSKLKQIDSQMDLTVRIFLECKGEDPMKAVKCDLVKKEILV